MPAPRGPRSGPRRAARCRTSAAASPGGSAASTSTRSNPQHVFVEGVSLAESLNGGATWTTSQTPHADQHAVEFDPFTAGQGLPRQRRRLLLVDRERRRARPLVQDPAPARDAVLRDGRLQSRTARASTPARRTTARCKSWGRQQHRQRRLVRLRRRRRDDEPHRPDERPEVLRLLPERRLPRLRRHGHRRRTSAST